MNNQKGFDRSRLYLMAGLAVPSLALVILYQIFKSWLFLAGWLLYVIVLSAWELWRMAGKDGSKRISSVARLLLFAGVMIIMMLYTNGGGFGGRWKTPTPLPTLSPHHLNQAAGALKGDTYIFQLSGSLHRTQVDVFKNGHWFDRYTELSPQSFAYGALYYYYHPFLSSWSISINLNDFHKEIKNLRIHMYHPVGRGGGKGIELDAEGTCSVTLPSDPMLSDVAYPGAHSPPR